MILRRPRVLAWALPIACWIAVLTPCVVRGANPPLSSPTLEPPRTGLSVSADDPAVCLERGYEFERRHEWQSAIQLYEDALKSWPSRTEFRQRLRLAQIHHRLNRRYQDRSFRQVLLKLSRDQVLALLDEVLDRIKTHYVEPVALDQLVRRGYDNVDVALRDQAFLRAHLPGFEPTHTVAIRDALRTRREGFRGTDRTSALVEVSVVSDYLAKSLKLAPSAVVLEFVYGACDALDDYTSYLTPDRLDDLYAMIDGNFVGLGIELKGDSLGLKLVGVLVGGPASEAGLKVGDRIVAVGPRRLAGLSLDEAANGLQGPENTSVDLTVLTSDGQERAVRLTRRAVEVRSVAQARIVNPAKGVGYIQLTGFQKTSTDELHRAISELQDQGMRSLVLDLRGNPGGLLNVAVEIADRFLDSGRIVTTRGRAHGQTQAYDDDSPAPWRMPLTVLIDHDSASASEILAGALKENGRALIVGEKSYGKGSVQSIFPLRSVHAGLKLTTAKFYSPRDRAYSEQGVEPDVPVRLAARPDPSGNLPVDLGTPGSDPVLDRAIGSLAVLSPRSRSGSERAGATGIVGR